MRAHKKKNRQKISSKSTQMQKIQRIRPKLPKSEQQHDPPKKKKNEAISKDINLGNCNHSILSCCFLSQTKIQNNKIIEDSCDFLEQCLCYGPKKYHEKSIKLMRSLYKLNDTPHQLMNIIRECRKQNLIKYIQANKGLWNVHTYNCSQLIESLKYLIKQNKDCEFVTIMTGKGIHSQIKYESKLKICIQNNENQLGYKIVNEQIDRIRIRISRKCGQKIQK